VFFVEARYHHNPKRAADQVRYIAHREEELRDGQRRELYGIGRDMAPSAATRRHVESRASSRSTSTAGRIARRILTSTPF
jgi:hypothetical protein